MKQLHSKGGLFLLGILFGLGAILLAMQGNPANMAICTACFIRDIAGALKFHQAGVVQYFRPEIIGIIAGAFICSLFRGEFTSRGGSATVLRFLMGMVMMICALVFLGCPLRMVLRMAAGDLSAYMGLIGFVGGVFTGGLFIKRGFTLGQDYEQKKGTAMAFPLFMMLLFVGFLAVPALFASSAKGPGSMHAPIILSLLVGVLVGGIAQLSRLCFSGAVRNVFLLRDISLLLVLCGLFLAMAIYNIMMGSFVFRAFGPVAHAETLWNILSMYAVGLAAILLGGCPLRQLILASSGSADSAMSVMGMFAGAAVAHNFLLTSAPAALATATTAAVVGGPSLSGQIAVIVSIMFLLGIGFWGLKGAKK